MIAKLEGVEFQSGSRCQGGPPSPWSMLGRRASQGSNRIGSRRCPRNKGRAQDPNVRRVQPARPAPADLRSLAYGRRGPRGNANRGLGPRPSRLRCDLRPTSGAQLCSCNDGPHKPSRCLSPPSEAPHRLFGPSLRSKPVTPADLPLEPRVQRFSGFRVAAINIKPSTAA